VFRGWHAFFAVAVVSVLGPALPSATAATGKDRLASAIETRLNNLGLTTTQMTRDGGYFYRNPVLPQRAFSTYAGCQQPFQFGVFVYKTQAQAVVMYEYFHQHVVKIGGDFHAFNMVRKGRVIYVANTAPAPDPNAPSVPSKDFRSLAAGVSAPLPSHPRACPQEASDL
jgi:hypothetical protein